MGLGCRPPGAIALPWPGTAGVGAFLRALWPLPTGMARYQLEQIGIT